MPNWDGADIFPASGADIELVRGLWREYWDSLELGPDFQDFAAGLRTLPGRYAPPAGRLLLATVQGKAAATGAFRPLEGLACEAKRLYVRPEFRGRGIGEAPYAFTSAWVFAKPDLIRRIRRRARFFSAWSFNMLGRRAIPYNPGMKRIGPALPILGILLACSTFAGEKKIPVAEGSNAEVAIKATFVDQDQLKQMVGTDFGKMFTALELQVTPRGGKPLAISYDDFELLSESSGEHGSPYEPGQISGSGALVLHREDKYGAIGTNPTSGVWSMGPIIAGSGGAKKPVDNRADMAQGDSKRDPLTDVLKQKMLPQETASGPASGLLIFPLSHEKPKHLVLFYKTTSGKLRMTFKD